MQAPQITQGTPNFRAMPQWDEPIVEGFDPKMPFRLPMD